MASIHRDQDSGVYRVMYRDGGKQFQKSLKTTDEGEAERLKNGIETTLLELDRGRKVLPDGADL